MTAIIVIVALAALVWGAVALRLGGFLIGCLAVLFLGSCFGGPFFTYELGPIPLTSDRLLMMILCVTYVAARRTSAVDRKPLAIPDVLLFVFVGYLAVSTITHDWRVENLLPLSRLVFYFLFPVAIYWTARQSRITETHLKVIQYALIGFAGYLALTAVAEVTGSWWAVWPRYIGSPIHEEFYGRARGPFLNPIACGLYLTAGLAGLMVLRRERSWANWSWQTGLALFLLIGLYCTLTRSIWLTAAMTVFVLGLALLPIRMRVPAGLAVAITACAILGTQWGSLQAFKRDDHVSVHAMSQSAGLRPVLGTVAWKMFQDRPLTGVGYGQYKQHDVDYWRDPTSSLPLTKAAPYEQHNTLLALLTETGLIGAGLFLMILFFWFSDTWKLATAKEAVPRAFGRMMGMVLATYFVNAMLHDVSVIPMVHMLVFTCAGVSRGLVLRNCRVAAPATCPPSTPLFMRHAIQ